MICKVCPHHCDIKDGASGFCRARVNTGGEIVCVNYGRLTSMALDPIEKKPLRRFFPGSVILSVGSFGCNLRCPFCQNYEISMADNNSQTVYVSPEELVREAESFVPRGNIGIAFTYNEPLVGYEYVRDCSVLAHERGLKTVLVTNGTICAGPLSELMPHIDAMNIDLKAFSQDFYKKICGDLETVKSTISECARLCHVEVTTLVIPGENDGTDEMEKQAKWLASIDPEMPLHISRFFPRYRLSDREPTPVETIYGLRDIARRHLEYVYTGNC